jgi:2-haloacid dehalogenase
LQQLKQSNAYNLYALTNWSAETFPIALDRFDFLGDFAGIIVSGAEKTRKPFQKIYEIAITRYNITPENAVFIDDNLDNVEAAKALGIIGIHFMSAAQLLNDLREMNIAIY